MELDILKKGGGNHKKRPGHQYQSPEQQRKTKIADALRQTYPLTELLHVLGLAVAVIFITGLH